MLLLTLVVLSSASPLIMKLKGKVIFVGGYITLNFLHCSSRLIPIDGTIGLGEYCLKSRLK